MEKCKNCYVAYYDISYYPSIVYEDGSLCHVKYSEENGNITESTFDSNNKSEGVVKFNWCPLCGNKIDWKKLCEKI
jgi:hypothetical protein